MPATTREWRLRPGPEAVDESTVSIPPTRRRRRVVSVRPRQVLRLMPSMISDGFSATTFSSPKRSAGTRPLLLSGAIASW